MLLPNLYLEHTYTDQTKSKIVHLIGDHFGLPKKKMPAFALRTPLAALLLWHHKCPPQLC